MKKENTITTTHTQIDDICDECLCKVYKLYNCEICNKEICEKCMIDASLLNMFHEGMYQKKTVLQRL